jgi:TonB-dependent SusC/RagA subfamily outer membrane receptor
MKEPVMKSIFSKILYVLVLLAVSLPAMAQRNVITGVVYDESGLPLTGASVIIEGTNRGVTTDSYGKYRIEAAPEEALIFNFLGYRSQKFKVGASTVLNAEMVPESQILDELVVVGYGVQKKVNVTGSVSTVDYEELSQSRPATTTSGLLQGVSAGLYVSQTSGKPGSEGVSMRIRGVGTLNDAAPLVIVDGFEGTINNVNPQDIASISVLKDAASCAIYGNRGANGVILITTKTAKEGRFNIEYTGMVAYQEPEHYFDVISNYADYMEIMNESAWNVGKANVFSQTMIDLWREKEKTPNGIADSGYPNYVAYPNVDWMEAIFTPSVYQKHSISASGSTERIKYLMSVSYMDNPGVIDNSTVTRTSYRFNLSSDVTEWLEVGARIYGYRSDTELADISGSMTLLSRGVPCIYPYYDGKYGWMENPEQSSESRNNLYFFNRYKGSNITHYNNTTVVFGHLVPVPGKVGRNAVAEILHLITPSDRKFEAAVRNPAKVLIRSALVADGRINRSLVENAVGLLVIIVGLERQSVFQRGELQAHVERGRRFPLQQIIRQGRHGSRGQFPAKRIGVARGIGRQIVIVPDRVVAQLTPGESQLQIVHPGTLQEILLRDAPSGRERGEESPPGLAGKTRRTVITEIDLGQIFVRIGVRDPAENRGCGIIRLGSGDRGCFQDVVHFLQDIVFEAGLGRCETLVVEVVSLETGHGRDIVFPVCSGPVERRLELPSSSVGLRVGQI